MKKKTDDRAQELCEQGGGPGSHSLSHSSTVPNNPYGFCGKKKKKKTDDRVQELCEQGGGPGLSFPISIFHCP